MPNPYQHPDGDLSAVRRTATPPDPRTGNAAAARHDRRSGPVDDTTPTRVVPPCGPVIGVHIAPVGRRAVSR
ncbi:hypothetical protein Van01_53650 [Micromonospora andamanensis]|uniref:Uncharacterized protein n=1 Tax=Micromonospora andamanensis TaxID=1287068 RepID=A0ABQ4I2P2_9ACTN|nr:hypothetical protein Van01_53650 [Micromonospora andamanensis]GIJ39315.1 hypothetical protein Vwe01_26400 [Micromonospora andamanensis]